MTYVFSCNILHNDILFADSIEEDNKQALPEYIKTLAEFAFKKDRDVWISQISLPPIIHASFPKALVDKATTDDQ